MYVIGTAGHVDHGKSTLVYALTGINPDRLAEEQRREMTIDLGFAHLTLPSGTVISIVDVPGHERFIKNMLAGVGGIDAALLIVAADEGVMPQTAEHLHILDLLGVEHGLVVLTKADLVDAEWLELVREDVRARLMGTTLAQPGAAWPILAVSARTGAGLPELRAALDALLERTPSRTLSRGVPRLPIDRAFTIGGFGTVVTGTLTDGPLALGQEIEVQPQGVTGRIRGLQTHGHKEETALPGTRVAANLSGIAIDQLRRGAVVSLPGHLRPTALLDIKLRLTTDAPTLKQNDALDLFVGASEVRCRATLLEAEELLPGAAGWVQLRLEHPIAVARGDRCIVRIPSPSTTIGGGRVADAYPARHRRFRPDVIQALETLSRGTPAEIVLQALGAEPAEWAAVAKRSGLDAGVAGTGLAELLRSEQALLLSGDAEAQPSSLVISTAGWARLHATITDTLSSYHKRWPLRQGMPREELKSKLTPGAGSRAADAVLRRMVAAGTLAATETTIRLAAWEPRLSLVQQRDVDALLRAFKAEPYSPPVKAEWEALGAELIRYLLESGRLVRVSPDVLFDAEAFGKLVEWTEEALANAGEVTVAGVRDHFGTTRKYALAFLEYLDERKITRRVGDVRVSY